jgi:hypothetical protein
VKTTRLLILVLRGLGDGPKCAPKLLWRLPDILIAALPCGTGVDRRFRRFHEVWRRLDHLENFMQTKLNSSASATQPVLSTQQNGSAPRVWDVKSTAPASQAKPSERLQARAKLVRTALGCGTY